MDTPGVYDMEREIDDLAGLVEAAGGSASLFVWSSGAGLALRAAASGRIAGIERIVAFEPPFVVDHEHHVPPADLAQTLHELVSADRRSETVRFYMTRAMGNPAAFVTLMRVLPMWSKLKATANSTPHDSAVMSKFNAWRAALPGRLGRGDRPDPRPCRPQERTAALHGSGRSPTSSPTPSTASCPNSATTRTCGPSHPPRPSSSPVAKRARPDGNGCHQSSLEPQWEIAR
ncbi:MAG: alpha/beta hydrolase [Acidimicrobiia bacterium]